MKPMEREPHRFAQLFFLTRILSSEPVNAARASRVIVLAYLTRELIMTISEQTPAPPPSYFRVRRYDGCIRFGYAAFGIILLATIWYASGGPGLPDADLALAMALP
jgi:hypothetical protein